MHIAQIAPLTEAIPPQRYGGTERVIHWLTEELVALGHDVTLFASGDSQTSATLEPMWPRALRHDGAICDPNALHMSMLEQVRRRATEFDFLHFHLDYYPFSIFSRQATPFVTTWHGRLDLAEHQTVFTTFTDAPVVSISDSQRRPVPQARWVRTVHHGLPEQLLTPRPVETVIPGISRAHIAGEGGRPRDPRSPTRAGLPLKIAAKVDKVDRDYFDRGDPAAARLSRTSSTSARSATRRNRNSSAAPSRLLAPIEWPEPFGLVMIEAMACGTPVIAFNRGSVPEVIEDGRDRFHRRGRDGAVGAVYRLARSVAAGHPPTFRGTVHRAADGAGLSRGLSQPDARARRRVRGSSPAMRARGAIAGCAGSALGRAPRCAVTLAR